MSKIREITIRSRSYVFWCKTLDSITDNNPLGEDGYGNKEYPITENIVDVDLESNHVYLQF